MRDDENHRPGFLGFVSLAQWTGLLGHGLRGVHQRGDHLFRQGEPGGTVRLLTAGRVKVVYSGADGSEVLLCLRGPGELLGEIADSETTRRMATIRAMEQCVSYAIPIDTFRFHLRGAGIEENYKRYLAGKLRETASVQWRTACGSVSARMADLLLTAVSMAGPEHRNPRFVSLTQEEIAGALGAARSSVTAAMRKWREAGLVKVERGGLVVCDTTALSEAVSE